MRYDSQYSQTAGFIDHLPQKVILINAYIYTGEDKVYVMKEN